MYCVVLCCVVLYCIVCMYMSYREIVRVHFTSIVGCNLDCGQEFVKVMRCGDVAMFLPRLRCLEVFVREEHHEMQRLASIEVERLEPREELGDSLLDVKQFLKQFDTTKHLQAPCTPTRFDYPLVDQFRF